jgi:hypothetical protein
VQYGHVRKGFPVNGGFFAGMYVNTKYQEIQRYGKTDRSFIIAGCHAWTDHDITGGRELPGI